MKSKASVSKPLFASSMQPSFRVILLLPKANFDTEHRQPALVKEISIENAQLSSCRLPISRRPVSTASGCFSFRPFGDPRFGRLLDQSSSGSCSFSHVHLALKRHPPSLLLSLDILTAARSRWAAVALFPLLAGFVGNVCTTVTQNSRRNTRPQSSSGKFYVFLQESDTGRFDPRMALFWSRARQNVLC